MAVEVEPSHQYSATFFAMWQITAEAQSDKTVTDMEIHMKKSWVTEFLYAEKKIVLIDIQRCILDIYGDHVVDVSTVRW